MCHPEQREGSRAGTPQETFARCFASLNMTNYALDNIYIILCLEACLGSHARSIRPLHPSFGL